jgi:hypothetical protein
VVGVAVGVVGKGEEGREGSQLGRRCAIKWETKPALSIQISLPVRLAMMASAFFTSVNGYPQAV